ncbi:MAG: glycosyltransferase [Clostridia bacterium]
MIKIFFHLRGIGLAGTEVAVYNLISCLSKLNKYDITVGYESSNNSKIMIDKFKKYAKVEKMRGKYETDVLVYCFYSIKNGENDIINNIIRKKTIFWQHFFGKNCILNNPNFRKSVNRIVCVSEFAKQHFIDLEKLDNSIKNKIDVIYNVINVNEILQKSNETIDLDFFSSLNLVTVSRINYAKGFKRMIKLAELLEKKKIDYKWYIIGEEYDNCIERNTIIESFKKFGERIQFLGELENPYNIMAKCDYTVLLSDIETWGFVITESKILDIPCIVTNFKSVYEQIEDGKTGIIVDKESTDKYSIKLDKIMEQKLKLKENLKKFKYNNESIIQYWDNLLSK